MRSLFCYQKFTYLPFLFRIKTMIPKMSIELSVLYIFSKWSFVRVKRGTKPKRPFWTFVEVIWHTKDILNEIYTSTWSFRQGLCFAFPGFFQTVKISKFYGHVQEEVLLKVCEIWCVTKRRRLLLFYTLFLEKQKMRSIENLYGF